MDSKGQIKSLLLRIAEDDEEAFSIFFRRYHAKLVHFALLFIPSHDLAEDVVSEVMIKLLRRRKEVFRMENFEAYLYMAIKNQSLNQLKKQKKFTILQPSELAPDYPLKLSSNPLEQIIEKELRQEIENTVNALPPKRKMVFQLVKDDGLKHKEVAELLEISVKTVENHLDLALKEIRTKVNQYLQDKKEFVKPVVFKTLVISLLIALGFLI